MGRSARSTFVVQPGKTHPRDYPADAPSKGPDDKTEGGTALAELRSKLAVQQDMLYARGAEGDPRSILLVLQGMDTSGKGGVTGDVVSAFNPAGVRFASFKAPTSEELKHDFLWRIHKQVPAAGLIGVFDRSHYEDVLVVKVRKLAEASVIEQRYSRINDFEAELTASGVTVVKCFLHISFDEQRERLLARLDDPAKHWKFREGDIDDRQLWPAFEDAYATALGRCSTAQSPWYVIPSNKKWYRNWAIASILLETFEDMNLSYPEVDLDFKRLKERLAPPN
ncbi:PPK2 family polyphosphate kinase [Smaragdicoccus niigatensis]|uniref:PPK2 family polyphosphate kinase n=1 Tax=Smaragdicoccus niigatensis TaxID=359359 RepID=UPI00037EF7F0|nr:PPK2 family polyphosphate kinase [Smaragdicoccus niigatensis]